MTTNIEPKKLASISIKSVGFPAKEIRKMVEGKEGEKVFLARVGGIATEYFTGTDKRGEEWSGLKGIFTLVNSKGDAFSSGSVLLPSSVQKRIINELKEGVVECGFMIDIFGVESDKNASGYAFNCEAVLSDEQKAKADTIAQRILKSMNVGNQLNAPDQKAAESEEAPKKAAGAKK